MSRNLSTAEVSRILGIREARVRELAREYATRRVRDSIEELRKSGQSEEELREIWNLYGESARVLGDDGYQDEIGAWVREIATGEQRDWQATLVKSGLPT